MRCKLQLKLVNSPPVAEIGGPYNVREGASILLDGSVSSDPNQEASALLYEWDFDYDGLTFAVNATGPTPTFDASLLDGHSTRTVAFRVTDAGGLTDRHEHVLAGACQGMIFRFGDQYVCGF